MAFPSENIQAAYLTEAFRFTFIGLLWPLSGRKMSFVTCQIITSFEVFIINESIAVRNFVLFSPLT